MRLRALVDIFVVSRIYRAGEEFEALNFDGIARDCVEVVSGEPVVTPKRVAPVRRAKAEAPAPATAAAVADAADTEKLNAMME